MNQGLSPVTRFFRMLKVDRKDIFTIYIIALFSGLINLSLPLGIQAIINLISGGLYSTSWVVLVVFVIIGIIATGALQVVQLYITENLQRKIFTRAAFEFAYRIPRLKLDVVDKYYVPELVNRFFDTLSVQKGLSKILIDFSTALLQMVFGLILLSFYHPFFILFSLVLVLLLFLIFRLTGSIGLRTSIQESNYKYEVVHWLEEVARALETFKLAGKTNLPLERADEKVSGYLNARAAHFRILMIQYVNMVGFRAIIAAGLLVIGGLLVLEQQMNIGQFVAAEIIIILVLASAEKLIMALETIYDVLTSVEKIAKITDIPLENDEGKRIKDLGDAGGLEIKIRDLSYQFSDAREPVLKNINLHVKPGECVCLAGFNGSGKSLLLQLIAGLYEDFTGSLTYNGIPIGNMCKESVRSIIGDNLAKGVIFRGSLAENISLRKESITFEDIKEIVEIVGLSEFIENQPRGFEEELNPEGKRLPQSIIAKIMLARCLVGKPRLLLIEDAFNRIEQLDRMRVLNYILDKEHDWTVIAVSNDMRINSRFDRIVGMNKGQIIEDGFYDDIYKSDWYQKVSYKE